MRKALRQVAPERSDDADGALEFERNHQLEILYYPPGYITPEEFFHRLLVGIHKMKVRAAKPITLLFNSLDQLGSRFPLCAREHIFVPGIVQMLNSEGVNSFFVAAQEADQPPEYYGLESLAELIIMFKRDSVPRLRYVQYAENHRSRIKSKTSINLAEKVKSAIEALPDDRVAVLAEVVRYAGGQAAGAKGILELIDEDDPKLPLFGDQIGLHLMAIPT